MFHLLVAHGGWGEREGNLPTSRVYISNDVEHEQHFLKSDGKRLNVEAIRSIPALLMAETGSDDIHGL